MKGLTWSNEGVACRLIEELGISGEVAGVSESKLPGEDGDAEASRVYGDIGGDRIESRGDVDPEKPELRALEKRAFDFEAMCDCSVGATDESWGRGEDIIIIIVKLALNSEK